MNYKTKGLRFSWRKVETVLYYCHSENGYDVWWIIEKEIESKRKCSTQYGTTDTSEFTDINTYI